MVRTIMSRQQKRQAARQAKKGRRPSIPTENASGDLDSLFENAIRLHGAGQIGQAVELYDQALSIAPGHPDALHLKGVACSQTGQLETGIELIEQALASNRDHIDYNNNLALLLIQAGRLKDAEATLRHVIALAPTHSPAFSSLADVLERTNQLQEATSVLRQATGFDPENAALWGNLGRLLEAIGEREDALAAFQKSVALAPQSPEGRNNFANVLKETGMFERAEEEYKRAIGLNPNYANAHQNLGSLLIEMHRIPEGIQSLRKAISLQPDLAQAHVNLAAGLNSLDRLVEGAAQAQRAIEIDPTLPDAHNNLGVALRALGDYKGAEAAYRRVIELDSSHARGQSNLIYALDFNTAYDVADHQTARREWYETHGRPLSSDIRPHTNDRSPQRRLRVGYVSADFRHHSATNGFGPMLLEYDRSKFDVICYASNIEQDDVTKRFRSSATEWRDCARLSDTTLSDLIREDGIDILVDLSGHSAGNRLLVFARKPAPVQVTAWGFGTGTGLETIDYFLTDEIVAPSAEHELYAEEIEFLPSHLPYMPPTPCPDVSPAPCLTNGFVTFGSFNRLEKMNDAALAAWSDILGGAPETRLVIKSQALDREPVLETFKARLTAVGIDPQRVDLLGGDPQPEHLAKHALVDLMLDPFPHGGGVSSSDSLWMGVPLITLLGNTVPGRLGASADHALGLDDFITNGVEDYVQTAIRLASQSDYIAGVRSSLRERIQACPVGDTKQYVVAVEEIYRNIWARWCAGRDGSQNG